MSAPTKVTLTPATGSFPFTTKILSLSPSGVKTTLGAQADESGVTPLRRQPAEDNGWFAAKNVVNSEGTYDAVSPLSLSPSHAQLWAENGQVWIEALETPWGTFVNGTKITAAMSLKSGDFISLGVLIPRNSKTPPHITDDHLKPVIFAITFGA